MNYLNVIVLFLSFSSSLLMGQASAFEELLAKINGRDSNPASLEILSLSDSISEKNLISLVQRAHESGNKDLMSIVESGVKKINWDKERSWEEGLDLSSKYSSSLECLAKWRTPLLSDYSSYFLASPDVPYQRVNEWHLGYLHRGIQGDLLTSIAKYDPESFKKIVAMLESDVISESKKRTILWAMRFDHTDFSLKFIEDHTKSLKKISEKELSETLSEIKRRLGQ